MAEDWGTPLILFLFLSLSLLFTVAAECLWRCLGGCGDKVRGHRGLEM